MRPAAPTSPVGTREHGTYARYTVGRCRCVDCRRANADYEKRRTRLKAYGRFPWVKPDRSREHLRELVASGCGVRTVARLSGVSRTTLNAILSGKPDASSPGGRRPLIRVHAETEERLLALEPGHVRQPGPVPATEVWRQIQEMVAFGVPKGRIARAMGKKRPALQLSKSRVSPENARAVANVHWALWLHEPRFRTCCRCPLPASVARRLEESV